MNIGQYATIHNMLRIYIDADSMTEKHRSIILNRALKENAEAYFVADRSLPDVVDAIAKNTEELRNPFRGSLDKQELRKIKSRIQMIVVETGANSADDMIVEIAVAPSLAITHDIPLASRLIEKGISVIDDRGNILNGDNIRERLSIRAINNDFREMGIASDKSKRFDQSIMNRFSSAFDKAVNNLK